MGKYKPYPEYKNSGVEWLGEVPEGWQITQVKYGYDVVLGKMLQPSPRNESDVLRPYLKAQNIQPEGVNIDRVESMWFSSAELSKLLLRKGDVLVSEGGDVGRAAIWNCQLQECYIQNAINRVRALEKNSTHFFFYWMSMLKQSGYVELLCNKATISHYTAEKLEGSLVVLPSVSEQTHIAVFLDHETAQIDRLIEKQEKLIKLLKEKRQAVVSHAVTKGLNSDAPMKDSGVEWLGKVPEHWDVKRVKMIIEFVTSGSRGWAQYYADFGALFFRIANLNRDSLKLKLKDLQYVNPPQGSEGERSRIREGDLLISITADLGSTAVATSDVVGGYVSQHVALARPLQRNVVSDYLGYSLLSEFVKNQFKASGYGGTKIQLSLEDIKELIVAIPSKDEQQLVVAEINRAVTKCDGLIQRAQEAIALLKERRTALISAAVTGKIDVRDWQKH